MSNGVTRSFLALTCALSLGEGWGEAQAPNWDSVRQAYFTKYTPTDTPAWLFPIVFEENAESGEGMRDTIYLGYDPNATNNLLGPDTVFGEALIPVDTNLFNASICKGWYCGSGILCDTTSKVNISHLSYYAQCGGGIFDIQFIKGRLPLKMWWDRTAFYSDSLPFADQSPAPRAQGRMWQWNFSWIDTLLQSGDWCPPTEEVLMTDTFTALVGCLHTDSVEFFDPWTPDLPPGQLTLFIERWTGRVPFGIAELRKPELTVYPVPATESLTVLTDWQKEAVLLLLNGMGQVVMAQTITGRKQLTIRHLPSGIYTILMATNDHTLHKRILIVHP